jgi:hypothetical protein
MYNNVEMSCLVDVMRGFESLAKCLHVCMTAYMHA